jgi:hypothetical protein
VSSTRFDQARKAYRESRHDREALEHVHRAGDELRHAATVLRERLTRGQRKRAEQLHELRRIDE